VRSWITRPVGAVLVAAALAAAATGGIVVVDRPNPVSAVTPTPTPPPAGVANLWVDANGGTCGRQGTAGAYSDSAACGSFSAAASAASCGDTVRVKTGVYGPQSADKSCTAPARVTFIGEDGTRIDSGTQHNNGLSFGNNATVDNVDVGGNTPFVYIGQQNVTWQNSTLLEGAESPNARSCINNDAEPILILRFGNESQGSNIRLDNVLIEDQHHNLTDTCVGGGLYHLEQTRLDTNIAGVTFNRVRWQSCSQCGSGHLFITATGTDQPTPSNVTVTNSIFEGANGAIHMNSNADNCVDWTIAYNTMLTEAIVSPGCTVDEDVAWIANAGQRESFADCVGTYTSNSWFDNFNPTGCSGTDEWAGDTVGDLLLDANYRPQAGSPLIDAGPATCSVTGGEDYAGGIRPAGSTCDPGAGEYQG